jgi:hypothetical protein
MNNKMDPEVLKSAEDVLFNLWYTIAHNIFNRVVEIAELDIDQIRALKLACLRPNDFRIVINGITDQTNSEDE